MLKISEIFGPTIQGEGLLIGEPCIFVRAGGCDFRCSWCDTMHAVDSSFRWQWKPMSCEEIFAEILRLSGHKPITISISGGNPAIQDFSGLIELGIKNSYRFAVETQGSIYQEWFNLLYNLVLSPKPPSSAMQNNWQNFDKCCNAKAKNIIIKVPVLNEEDYLFARDVASRYPNIPFYLQPVNDEPPTIESLHKNDDGSRLDLDKIRDRFVWLLERTKQDKWFDIRILPQLHILIWRNKGGV